MNKVSMRRAVSARYEDRIAGYDLPDILEYCTEYIGLDLAGHSEGASDSYYNGKCPLHDAEHNFTTFAVYPNNQLAICFSCHPTPMNIVELHRLISFRKGVPITFDDALAQLGTKLSSEAALAKKLAKVETDWYDLRFFADRIRQLFYRLQFEEAMRYAILVNDYLDKGQRMVADKFLRSKGV